MVEMLNVYLFFFGFNFEFKLFYFILLILGFSGFVSGRKILVIIVDWKIEVNLFIDL